MVLKKEDALTLTFLSAEFTNRHALYAARIAIMMTPLGYCVDNFHTIKQVPKPTSRKAIVPFLQELDRTSG